MQGDDDVVELAEGEGEIDGILALGMAERILLGSKQGGGDPFCYRRVADRGGKPAGGVDHVGEGGGRENGLTTQDNEVQADGQPRSRPRQCERLVRSLTGHHQTGARDDPRVVGLGDGEVDLVCAAEVVGVDDQPHGGRLRGYTIAVVHPGLRSPTP